MAFEESREKLGLVSELWAFMKVRKKWWLGPIVVMLVLLGLLIVLTQGNRLIFSRESSKAIVLAV